MQNMVPYINKKLTYITSEISISLRCKYAHMSLNTGQFNTFLFFKLPSAWWCGVRLTELEENHAVASVRYRWINQNPFKSMFWAVQGMAAELATGALVMQQIRKSGKSVSMLVLTNKANFHKKARGRIFFRCEDGPQLNEAMDRALASGEGHTVWMKSIGTNENGEVVSEFDFEWTIKVKGSG